MSSQFIFVHGWGMAPNFWDALIKRLPKLNARRVNLGFIGEESDLLEHDTEEAIFITHSLGTMWALKKHHANIKALIAINGFSCFHPLTDERTLRTMKIRLEKKPEAQMKDFWDMCDLPHNENLNTERLKEGLEWLSSWDVQHELKTLTCPILAMAGRDDPILPMDNIQKQWTGFDLHICENGGHVLPISNTKWCADHIKVFTDAL